MAEPLTRRPYVRPVPRLRWFLRHPRYLRYMAREVSCLFIGGYTLLFVLGLHRLAEGPQAWAGFLAALASPGAIVFHLFALAFSAYHSITWFRLTPKGWNPLPLASVKWYGGLPRELPRPSSSGVKLYR